MAPLRSLGNTLSAFRDFYARTGSDASSSGGGSGASFATGGTISDYEVSGTFYRAHIFTASGSLVVSSPISADILAVGGGGGSGRASGNGNFGGAGAGGMLTQTGVALSPGTTCPITIGGGGAYFGSTSSSGNYGGNGVDTAFTIPTGPTVYTAAGGGGGGGADATSVAAWPIRTAAAVTMPAAPSRRQWRVTVYAIRRRVKVHKWAHPDASTVSAAILGRCADA